MTVKSQPSEPRQISKLFGIPILLAIAHILNFVVSSPSSTWQEFPPKLPDSVYIATFVTPFLLFTSLTFEPIQTRKRFTLLSLALIFMSIPLSFRGRKYPHNLIVGYGVLLGSKMLLFLKHNRAYLDQKGSIQKKEFKSYLQTLFNWRMDDPENSDEKKMMVKSPTTSQINKKLFSRLVITIIKWLIYELTIYTMIKYIVRVPEKAYQIRLVEFITKGIPPVKLFSMLQYLNFVAFIYLYLSLNYDIPVVVYAIFYRIFYSTSEKNHDESILIRSGLLTPSEYLSLKGWIITLLFNSNHLFDVPWISSSPRDFWVRWQLLLSETFKELGYLPTRDFFIPLVPRKIASAMGVLGAFGVSALLHEYMVIGDFDIWTGEQFFFFMAHGVIFVLWEAVFGCENKNNTTKVEKFLKWVLLTIIYLSILPAFAESITRNADSSFFLSYFIKYYL